MKNVKKTIQIIKKGTPNIIKFLLFYAVIIPACFYIALYQTYKFIENRDAEIYQTGYEIGYWDGNIAGQDVAYDDIYNKLSSNPEVVRLFKKYFPVEEEARIMRAISLAESKGKKLAVNYNCLYGGKSMQCKKGDEHKAWSKDVGFFQISTQHAPEHKLYDLEENFKYARKILDTQGLNAWVVYNNQKYKQYLPQ